MAQAIRQTGDAFRTEMNIAVLESERKRVLFQAIFISVMFVLFLFAFLFLRETRIGQMLERTIGEDGLFIAMIVLLAFILYELAFRAIMGLFLKKKKMPPVPARYANVIIETNLATGLLIIIMSGNQNPEIVSFLPPVFAYFIFIGFSVMRLDWILCIVAGVSSAIGYGIIAMLSITQADSFGPGSPLFNVPHHVGKMALLIGAGIAVAVAAHILKKNISTSFEHIAEKNEIRSIFGKHVSPEVVDRLLAQQYEETENRYVCVMFLDIRNFTTFSEKRTPEEVVNFLNDLFTHMIDAVNRHNGIINKFLGDGFMAVFGAPISEGRDCQNAVNASFDILKELEQMVESGKIPQTRVGIGLHAGEVIAGNVGSDERKEYTIIGDAVNTASRIESLNKQLESMLLISEEVWSKIDQSQQHAEKMEPIQVKGREEPVNIYKLA